MENEKRDEVQGLYHKLESVGSGRIDFFPIRILGEIPIREISRGLSWRHPTVHVEGPDGAHRGRRHSGWPNREEDWFPRSAREVVRPGMPGGELHEWSQEHELRLFLLPPDGEVVGNGIPGNDGGDPGKFGTFHPRALGRVDERKFAPLFS